MTVEILPYDSSRREDALDLLDRVYGERLDPRELDWWFDGNPVGPRTLVLAEEAGRVVGMLGASFYRTILRGRETLAVLPLWAATDAVMRGRGIFQQLNAEIERIARAERAALELGFTNRMAGPIYVSKLGWVDVRRLRVWARQALPVGRGRAGDLDSFGSDQELAYRQLAPRMGNHFVRDRAYLNWRYTSSPRPYTILASRSGYAVVGRKRLRGLPVGFVADLVAPTFRETLWLLRRCARASRGTTALLALVPRVHRRAFIAFGFVPTPMTIRLIGNSLDDGRVPADWHFALGDTDFF